MQKNKSRSCLQMLFISLVTAFVALGCTKEDLSMCRTAYQLSVKAYDADGKELSTQEVKDITLYIFDNNKSFIETRQTQLNTNVSLDYTGHETLTVVAWGNTTQGSHTMPTLKTGDKLDEAFVSLTRTRTMLPSANTPGDLFHGSIEIVLADQKSEQLLPVGRTTSSITITARSLKEFAKASDEDFQYVIRKSSDKLDFYGKPNGEDVSHSPEGSFNDKGEFITPVFNIFPTDEDIKIDIFHRGVLLTTIIADNQGNPLRAVKGRLLNVLIDFGGSISVSVSVTPWGEKQIWKDF